MFLSVIIITWNSKQYVKDCIVSVLDSCRNISSEIIVVDNGSTDNTKEIIKSFHSERITLLPQNENLGVARARNIGIKQAKGRYIWILDIDTVVNSETIQVMLHFMEETPRCGICACKLINSDGEVQDSCRKLPTIRYKINNVLETVLSRFPGFSSLKRRIHTRNESQFYRKEINAQLPFEVEYVIGACQVIRQKVFDDVGLFDEKIFYGPEDADFCLRAKEKKWHVFCIPAYTIIHEYQRMTNKKLISKMSWIHAKALFYYFLKHKNSLE